MTGAKAKIETLHKKRQEAMKEVGQSKLLLEQAKDNKKRRVRGGDKGLYLYE
jgi:multidrug resistance efflux pump